MINRPGTMTSRERVLAALNHQPVDRIPYCEHLVDPLVALKTAPMLGLGDPAPLANALQEIREAEERGDSAFGMQAMFGLDSIISPLLGRDNITYWGGAMCFPGGYMLAPEQAHLGPAADGVLKTRDDLNKMQFTPLEPVIEGAKAFLQGKGDMAACALIFLGIDPCWHSMGWETFAVACLTDPDLVNAVLGPICDWYVEAARELCKLDFDFIWAADDIAFKTAPFFSPQVYHDLLLPHTRRVAAEITKPWIYHSDGNLLPIWDDLISQGMNAIHPLEAGSMDVAMLKREYGERVAFCGGVDLRLLEAGTPEETAADTRRLIDILGPGGGYLLCTSNSVTPHVIPENLAAMLRTLQEHGSYPLGQDGG